MVVGWCRVGWGLRLGSRAEAWIWIYALDPELKFGVQLQRGTRVLDESAKFEDSLGVGADVSVGVDAGITCLASWRCGAVWRESTGVGHYDSSEILKGGRGGASGQAWCRLGSLDRRACVEGEGSEAGFQRR